MLTRYEAEVYEWLLSIGVTENFPYIENGLEGCADNIEDIYFKAVFSYETFEPIVQGNKHYSPNELKNISVIQRYQQEMGAYYSPFQVERSGISEEVVNGYGHQKIKETFNKANRKNKGIYYISTFQGYTSTTLYENPIIEVSEAFNRPRKERLFGRLSVVVPETMRLYDGTELTFQYPFMMKGREVSSNSIYEVYSLAYKHPEGFELINSKKFYSNQQRKIIKKLKELGGIV